MSQLDGFTSSLFTHEGKTREVLRRGEGPAVLVIHEIPGITPQVAAFARRVADEGLTVMLPVLFGTPGKPIGPLYVLSSLAQACVSSEFACLAKRRSSPITDWLRALCRGAHQECGGPGVGAIGMCLTGGFALSLLVEPSLMAPVLSQPSLPFPISRGHRKALGISPEELEAAKRRCAAGVPLIGLRFTADPMCPKERFDTLRQEFGDSFKPIEIDSSPGNAAGVTRLAHSVVTTDLVDREGHPTREALDQVLTMFRRQLLGK